MRFTIELEVEVSDPEAVWVKAQAELIRMNIATSNHSQYIGTRSHMRTGNCIALLLDRNDLLEGAQIVQHWVTSQ